MDFTFEFKFNAKFELAKSIIYEYLKLLNIDNLNNFRKNKPQNRSRIAI
jgi:hypothetical protein